LDELRAWEWNPASYNVADAFALLLNTEYAPLDQRLRTVLKRLQKVPAYYAAAAAERAQSTREHTRLAIEQNHGALDVFGSDLEKQIAGSGLSAQERKLFAQAQRRSTRGIKNTSMLEALTNSCAKRAGALVPIGAQLYDEKFAFANPRRARGSALRQRAG